MEHTTPDQTAQAIAEDHAAERHKPMRYGPGLTCNQIEEYAGIAIAAMDVARARLLEVFERSYPHAISDEERSRTLQALCSAGLRIAHAGRQVDAMFEALKFIPDDDSACGIAKSGEPGRSEPPLFVGMSGQRESGPPFEPAAAGDRLADLMHLPDPALWTARAAELASSPAKPAGAPFPDADSTRA